MGSVFLPPPLMARSSATKLGVLATPPILLERLRAEALGDATRDGERPGRDGIERRVRDTGGASLERLDHAPRERVGTTRGDRPGQPALADLGARPSLEVRRDGTRIDGEHVDPRGAS